MTRGDEELSEVEVVALCGPMTRGDEELSEVEVEVALCGPMTRGDEELSEVEVEVALCGPVGGKMPLGANHNIPGAGENVCIS